MIDLPPKDIGCHRSGFEKACRELVVSGRCSRWRQLLGTNPQTGEPVARYDCIDNHRLTLDLEIAKHTHEATKATLDFRNAVIDPEIRARQIAKRTEELKQIEAQ